MASTTHVPTAVKLTTAPAIEHTEVAVASMERTTGLLDPPPIAPTVYVGPPTTASDGAVDVNVIAWFVFHVIVT